MSNHVYFFVVFSVAVVCVSEWLAPQAPPLVRFVGIVLGFSLSRLLSKGE